MCIVCYCVLHLFLFQMDLDPIVHRHVPMCHVPHRHVPPTPDGVSACLIVHVTLRVEMGEMNTILIPLSRGGVTGELRLLARGGVW